MLFWWNVLKALGLLWHYKAWNKPQLSSIILTRIISGDSSLLNRIPRVICSPHPPLDVHRVLITHFLDRTNRGRRNTRYNNMLRSKSNVCLCFSEENNLYMRMAEASAHANGPLVAMWICSDNVSTKGFEVMKWSCCFFTRLQYCYQGTGRRYRSCKEKKCVSLSTLSSPSNNLFHTSLAPWYSLLLRVLTFLKKYVALCSQREINEVNFFLLCTQELQPVPITPPRP